MANTDFSKQLTEKTVYGKSKTRSGKKSCSACKKQCSCMKTRGGSDRRRNRGRMKMS